MKTEIKEAKKDIKKIIMNLDAEAIFEKDINISGTGGHIIIPSKYIGRKAIIMILKE